MAVPIVTTDVPPTDFVNPTSRYIDSEVILWGENRLLTFNTYKRTPIDVTEEDQFTVIKPGDEFRPDLTSFRVYGTVDFWWRIMEANGLADIFDYRAGLNIRLPSSIFFV